MPVRDAYPAIGDTQAGHSRPAFDSLEIGYGVVGAGRSASARIQN